MMVDFAGLAVDSVDFSSLTTSVKNRSEQMRGRKGYIISSKSMGDSVFSRQLWPSVPRRAANSDLCVICDEGRLIPLTKYLPDLQSSLLIAGLSSYNALFVCRARSLQYGSKVADFQDDTPRLPGSGVAVNCIIAERMSLPPGIPPTLPLTHYPSSSYSILQCLTPFHTLF